MKPETVRAIKQHIHFGPLLERMALAKWKAGKSYIEYPDNLKPDMTLRDELR